MMRVFTLLAAAVFLALPATGSQTILHAERLSADDLEIGEGPSSAPRYIRYDDLLRLPQETYTVSDDENLPRATEISGVSLEALARALGRESADLLMVAVCDDRYQANYPHDYVEAHHPLLVLRMNGKRHDQWPRLKDGSQAGPYMISHPFFVPAFRVLSHFDEAQIPYGVVRLEFRSESQVFARIRPSGAWPADSAVEQGYTIARQDCLRCHSALPKAESKSQRSWLKLATDARQNPARFRRLVRTPTLVNARATMPAHGDYDDATLNALTAYFSTLDDQQGKP